MYQVRKVIHWNPPDENKRYEIFLECLHSVFCHTEVDKYPEDVPRECECVKCGPIDNLERLPAYVLR